jgi:hypothetical protein
MPLVDIPVVDRDEVLGHIELDLAPGRSLRDRDPPCSMMSPTRPRSLSATPASPPSS